MTSLPLVVSMTQLKFIPVRGRKLFRALCVDIITDVEIYPREGTETAQRLVSG